MYNFSAQINKGIGSFQFFKKKDVSEMTHKILTNNKYLVFTL